MAISADTVETAGLKLQRLSGLDTAIRRLRLVSTGTISFEDKGLSNGEHRISISAILLASPLETEAASIRAWLTDNGIEPPAA